MKTIGTKDLYDLLRVFPVALLDVRGELEYDNGHIPGAEPATLGSLVSHVADAVRPSYPVVVYSTDGYCPLAVDAVARLEDLRMTNVYLYEDGLEGWQEAGYEVVESPHADAHAPASVTDALDIIIGGNSRATPSSSGFEQRRSG